jgi:hypothetical protein
MCPRCGSRPVNLIFEPPPIASRARLKSYSGMLRWPLGEVGWLAMDFVSVWKAISVLSTGAFGILGLLTKFRDENTKKVTPWGYASLAGILISSALGFAAQLKEQSAADKARIVREIETQRSVEQAVQLAKKSDETLRQLKRLISPLNGFALELVFQLDCESDLQPFCLSARDIANNLAQNFPKSGHFSDINAKFFLDRDEGFGHGEVVGPNYNLANIEPDSKIWNSWPQSEPDIYFVAYFFRNAKDLLGVSDRIAQNNLAAGIVTEANFDIEFDDPKASRNGYVVFRPDRPLASFADLDHAVVLLVNPGGGSSLSKFVPYRLNLLTSDGQIGFARNFTQIKLGKIVGYQGEFITSLKGRYLRPV